MKVLIACECSGTVRDAFIARGHDAISCDLQDTVAPGPHYKGSVFDIIDKGWDLMVAHPPCTHLAVSGARHFAKKIADGRQKQGIDLFMQFINCRIPKWCIENPVGIMSRIYRKPDQIIQPWQFGDSFQKTTCLWLNWLPNLAHTKIVDKGEFAVWIDKHGNRKSQPKWYADSGLLRMKDKVAGQNLRSKTFPGIAKAMAEQWG